MTKQELHAKLARIRARKIAARVDLDGAALGRRVVLVRAKAGPRVLDRPVDAVAQRGRVERATRLYRPTD